ncbi:sodium/glucose cotransporter 4 [Lingula anatina]|uniref:Sodium/glucose cotransporter 4 n=1 Tax=Lingula anatina TaxID=7574 RepID=A0A1S3IEL5_LINAN|nr:sodium/glucose cotransporter 4 [Lingula anatina]|eukprot:XP_013395904.1 sodium/glucose cotransporter 4 [Lingula anatina]
MAQENTLEVADYGVMAGHFVLTVAVVIWSITRSSRGHSHGYFLAGRDMAWWLVGFSLYISDIGSISLIGIAGAAAADGIAVICYEFTGIFCVLLLGFVFAPVYISASVYTMPEYLRKRFGSRRLQIYLAVQNLLLLVFTKLSAGVFVGVLIVQQVLGWDVYLSLLVLLTGTALYTLLGGLTAIIYTDALQTVILLVGSTVLAVIGIVYIH